MNPTAAEKMENEQSWHGAILEKLRQTILGPSNGVVGLVDDLLSICAENALELDWQGGRCLVRWMGQAAEIRVPVRKSVFRAALARFAAVCNEQTPNSVSPYGGSGQLSIATKPRTVLQVMFRNTADDQCLAIRPG